MMRILCPRCSQREPVVIQIGDDEEATVCPRCHRRFRLRTFRVLENSARLLRGRYLYRVLGQESDGSRSLERIPSASALAIKPGRLITTVRFGSRIEGIADQSSETWLPITPGKPRFPLFRRLGVALAWPVTILALLQAFRFWQEAARLLQEEPRAAVMLFFLLALAALGPVLWWLLQTVFPDGPTRKRLIPGWKAPGLDDD